MVIFFHSRTHNLQANDYTSDITITEFPALYYAIGMLYRVFGYHEFIYKLINILIGFTGLYFFTAIMNCPESGIFLRAVPDPGMVWYAYAKIYTDAHGGVVSHSLCSSSGFLKIRRDTPAQH